MVREMKILHVATAADWERAQREGRYTGNTLATEGFIHCAKPEQLMHVLISYFPQVSGHVLVELETGRLQHELRWEGTTAEGPFPHVYGPLNMTAVTRVKVLV